MFKSSRWRSDKIKVKAVFKLQFQATQVPESKKSTLTVSLIPADVGKPTVRLGKASVLNGTCFWDNPVYETVKLTKEQKTGIYKEKFYHFVVSRGSSKSGYLGESYVNFADFIETTKPFTVSLPLETSNSGAILHVTVQRMLEDDQRHVEESEAPMEDWGGDGNANLNLIEDEHLNNFTSQYAEQTHNFRDIQLENTTICQDHTTLRQNSMPQKRLIEAIPTENHVHRRSNRVSMGSNSDGSMVDSTNSPEESFPRDRSQEASDRSIESLRSEISMLERQAEVSELELQTLRKQILKENKRGHDLSRKVVSLNEERDALKTEFEKLKKYVDAEVPNQLQIEIENLRVMLHEVRQELDHEKDLNTTLRLQLYKTEDSNSELVLAVRDLDEMLEQKNREISQLSSLTKASQNAEEEVDLLKQKISDLSGEIEVYRKEREELKLNMEQLVVNYEILEQENHDVSSKLGQNQTEQMKKHNECLEMSAIIKEFKFQVESLEKEIKKQALELSESSDTINQLDAQVKSLENELEKQAESFEDDLEAMTRAKVEQEQRAIQAEEALRKTRWNNANAAERLQEEFRKLSVEMASKFDENENKAMKAVAEANDLRQQKSVLEELLQKANEELGLIKDQYELKLLELSNQTDMKTKQIEKMSLELHDRCAQVQSIEKRKEESLLAFTAEIQMLKGEIEKLKMEKSGFTDEVEQKEEFRDETEQGMLQRRSNKREELEREFSSARKDAKKLHEELGTLRSLKDENETIIGTLHSEVEKLRVEYNDLKHCLFKVEHENENLRKQVFVLEGDQQKEEAITSIEKKFKDAKQMTLKEAGLDVALLKERNKVMERELKDMEERYSEISLKFAEVEGERQQLVMTIRCLKNGKKN